MPLSRATIDRASNINVNIINPNRPQSTACHLRDEYPKFIRAKRENNNNEWIS